MTNPTQPDAPKATPPQAGSGAPPPAEPAPKSSPAKGTRAKGALAKGAPAKGAPAKGAPAKGAPAKGAPAKGTDSAAAKPGPAAGKPGAAAVKSGKGATASSMTPEARRAQSKKIVNKRQRPWGLIVTTVVILILAIGIVGYAVNKSNDKSKAANPANIAGIAHFPDETRNHVTTTVKYAQSPPVGGDHSPIWADCNGTIYPDQIANENAVHPLEHGAVWITYRPGLPTADLDALTKLVAGKQYIFMSPYAGLKTNVSLQAWGYQLFVDSASDKRVKQFITDLRLNTKNTPEPGASCDNPTFKTTPSTLGKPTEQ